MQLWYFVCTCISLIEIGSGNVNIQIIKRNVVLQAYGIKVAVSNSGKWYCFISTKWHAVTNL